MRDISLGVYDRLITSSLREALAHLPPTLTFDELHISGEDAIEYLVREGASRARRILADALVLKGGEAALLTAANSFLGQLTPDDEAELSLLTAVRPAVTTGATTPKIPLSQSALVTNEQSLNYHAVLRSELHSADRVDLICPFIGNQGLNLVLDILSQFGPRLRVITTTYLGATNQRAIERLANTGALVKIVYERTEQRTGLHAKAWIFHRDSGFTTATLGSSNLSPRALVDGLEWNVRLSGVDAPQVLNEVLVTFQRLWEDPQYELYEPSRDSDKLRRALREQRADRAETSFFADIQPMPHQQEALDELALARLEGRSRNLIVAATGTGKTLLAAFDYQRLAAEVGGRPTLLFVAHREDILRQSLGAFRAVMRDGDFGELNVGFDRADQWRHVFASIQSFSAQNLETFEPTHFDIVVMDEFHHAEAPTYVSLLNYFRPRQLLGLTATPERSDGRNVIDQFGAPTYELRLWHALERNLLCPFHYFGVDDGTDLTDLTWSGGRYSDADLERRYIVQGEARAALILREFEQKIDDPERMRVVAFCATIQHANFMAQMFRNAGHMAEALHSGLPRDHRRTLVRRFRDGDLSIICTVDLFNEGVDIPEINTVLFLRPTESATVYIQQLGRGLRNHPEKGALTVLDFVGRQNQRFRMDLRFRAMTGLSRTELEKAVKSEFPMLPPGCNIRLDKTTQERVLQNLRSAIPSNLTSLADEVRRLSLTHSPVSLRTFLSETGLELSDLYRQNRSFSAVLHAAGQLDQEVPEARRAGSFIHVDDRWRANAYTDALSGNPVDPRIERMLAFTLTRTTGLNGLEPGLKAEALELMQVIGNAVHVKPAVAADLLFALHAHYSRDEIVAAFRENPASMRQGTFFVEELSLDIHILTLRKSERDFSPTTRYADYFLAPDKLHWESQSTTTAGSPTGQRLIQGKGRHLFFVRETRDVDGRVAPFMCLGFGTPISSQSERPIRLVWQLDHSVPDHVYVRFRSAAG